jgi:DNA-binding protein H-NS
MSTYKELLKQREELEQQINEARSRELAEAVSKVLA